MLLKLKRGGSFAQINVGSTIKEKTLVAATPQNYTLSDGSMKSLLDKGATYTALKYLKIVNTGENLVEISGNFFDISTEKLPIPVGGAVIFDYGSGAGETVTGTTKDVITIESTSGSEFSMEIAGVGSIS